MAKLIERVKLICSSVEKNNNKVWIGDLYDNGDVITRWGRIRDAGVSLEDQLDCKTFPGAGESFLRRKEQEKLRPKKDKESYTRARTIDDVSSGPVAAKVQNQSSLQAIAREQLAKNNPELSRLIDKLVQANIHNIVSQTSLQYNSATGLFQTPIGVITQDAIDEARNLLVEIKRCMINKCITLSQLVNSYLRIIPHDVGMRLTIDSVFPDLEAIKKESDILDSLEASYKTVVASPPQQDDKPSKPVAEKVFEVDFDMLSDSAERERLEKWFRSSKKSMHGYGNIKIQQIFSVRIVDMDSAFNRALGNNTEVYHGTSQANLLSILKSGLKTSPPSSAYIAGKMFGNGIYGAINSSKSLGYTYGRWGGTTGDSGWLFVCDFAMGKVHYPNQTCSRPATGCDSVWARASQCGLCHDELIVYQNNQVNVKYLLECK